MKEETRLRTELVDVCRKLAEKGLIAATDGNVSCRVGEDRLLITPSGIAKGELKAVDLLLVDLQGAVLAGGAKPSSEARMHFLIYKKRPDVHAVVHAHPPLLTAFTLAGVPFVAEALPEVWLTIGAVPTASYATPSTEEAPDSITGFVEDCQAILLERHGSLTFGKNLKEAYMRLEKLEHAAHTLFYAQLLTRCPPEPLPEDALAKLASLYIGKK
jgi:L-fuculose-phosphate aldolase